MRHAHNYTHTPIHIVLRVVISAKKYKKQIICRNAGATVMEITKEGLKGMWRAAQSHTRAHTRWHSRRTGSAVGEDPRRGVGETLYRGGFPWHWKCGRSMWWGRANQREEKPVAKLQPTTCVMSQICGDKQPMTTTEAAPVQSCILKTRLHHRLRSLRYTFLLMDLKI